MQVLSHVFVVAGVLYPDGQPTARLSAFPLYGTPPPPFDVSLETNKTTQHTVEYCTADIIQPSVVLRGLYIIGCYVQVYSTHIALLSCSICVCTRGEG